MGRRFGFGGRRIVAGGGDENDVFGDTDVRWLGRRKNQSRTVVWQLLNVYCWKLLLK